MAAVQNDRHSAKNGVATFVLRSVVQTLTVLEKSMVKSTRLQMIAVLAVGGFFGYVVASSRLDVFRMRTCGGVTVTRQRKIC